MEFRQIRYFLAVAEYRNFTQAANVLHIAQPTLSQQISELERTLNIKLLYRTKRSVELTPAGEALRKEAILLEEQYQRCLKTVAACRSGESGKIVLATLDTMEFTFLPEFFSLFVKKHPSIEIIHNTGTFREIQQMLLNRTADIGFNVVSLFDETEKLINIPINHDRMVIAVTDTPERKGLFAFEDHRTQDLLSHPCFLWSGWHNHTSLLDFLHEVSADFNPIVLDKITAVFMRVISEDGFTLLPELFLGSFRHIHPMIGISLPEPYSTLDMQMIYHAEQRNPCVDIFVNEAMEYIDKRVAGNKI